MKIINYGDKTSRYTLIISKAKRESRNKPFELICFSSNSLEELRTYLYKFIINHPINSNFVLDLDIFDYRECKYIK